MDLRQALINSGNKACIAFAKKSRAEDLAAMTGIFAVEIPKAAAKAEANEAAMKSAEKAAKPAKKAPAKKAAKKAPLWKR